MAAGAGCCAVLPFRFEWRRPQTRQLLPLAGRGSQCFVPGHKYGISPIPPRPPPARRAGWNT
eukprot:4097389-Alexandrium_andersonii.AAC.1